MNALTSYIYQFSNAGMKEYKDEVEAADDFGRKVKALKQEVNKVIVGQEDVLDALLTSIFSNGHCLLVGVPGLAKTLLVNTISQALGLNFSRIQFTPDLMPSDIIGSEILDEHRNFKFIKGPIFANIILADEINRTPPKTQSALLEAMQERVVTAAGNRYTLQAPFFVLATQNPIEQEGTYPLPEAQLDRFALKVIVGYPSREDEALILERMANTRQAPVAREVVSLAQVEEARALVDHVALDPRLAQYLVDLVFATREPAAAGLPELVTRIQYGGSPRATIWLSLAARAHAIQGGGDPADGAARRRDPARGRRLPPLHHPRHAGLRRRVRGGGLRDGPLKLNQAREVIIL